MLADRRAYGARHDQAFDHGFQAKCKDKLRVPRSFVARRGLGALRRATHRPRVKRAPAVNVWLFAVNQPQASRKDTPTAIFYEIMAVVFPRQNTPPSKASFFLLGLRGTGKSTWTRATFPHAATFNLLDYSV